MPVSKTIPTIGTARTFKIEFKVLNTSDSVADSIVATCSGDVTYGDGTTTRAPKMYRIREPSEGPFTIEIPSTFVEGDAADGIAFLTKLYNAWRADNSPD